MSWVLAGEPTAEVVGALHSKIFGAEQVSQGTASTEASSVVLDYVVQTENTAEPVGFARVGVRGAVAEVVWFGVVPQRRRQGAATRLLDSLERALTRAHARRLEFKLGAEHNIMLSMLLRRGYQLRPASVESADGWSLLLGRELRPRRELRYSLTERCNFDCLFCHNEGLGRHEEREQVSVDQVVDTLIEAIELGYTDITFTGGEPLLQAKRLRLILTELGSRAAEPPSVSVVTNGFLLSDADVHAFCSYPGELKIHVSLHATTAATFATITRRSPAFFERVLTNVRRATSAGLRVKVNYVVLQELNHRTILAAVDLALEVGASAIKFLELLVLPENGRDFEMYYGLGPVRRAVEQVADGPTMKNGRQHVYRHRGDARFEIEVQRLTCHMGCISCPDVRDRTLSSDLKYHPCFVRCDDEHDVSGAGGLVRAFEDGDRVIDDYAARYGNQSPSLVEQESFVACKREYFYELDDAAKFVQFLAGEGYEHISSMAFHEEYFWPRQRSEQWSRFERVLKIGWDRHDRDKVVLIYTDCEYAESDELGREVRTTFLDPRGPMVLADYGSAERFLDRLDFERFLTLDWELKRYNDLRQGGELGFTVADHPALATAKLEVRPRDMAAARVLLERAQVARPLCEPLPQAMFRLVSHQHFCRQQDGLGQSKG